MDQYQDLTCISLRCISNLLLASNSDSTCNNFALSLLDYLIIIDIAPDKGGKLFAIGKMINFTHQRQKSIEEKPPLYYKTYSRISNCFFRRNWWYINAWKSLSEGCMQCVELAVSTEDLELSFSIESLNCIRDMSSFDKSCNLCHYLEHSSKKLLYECKYLALFLR